MAATTLAAATLGAAGASSASRELMLGASSTDPLEVPENYTRALGLFEKDPSRWGGAYADGDTLVIKVVGQSLDAAAASATSVGIEGSVKLVAASVSLADLEEQQERIEEGMTKSAGRVADGWGPNYRTSSIVVDSADPVAAEAIVRTSMNPGGARVEVVKSNGTPRVSSRYFDTIRYYGGNAINLFASPTGLNRTCSTAFQMKYSDGYSYAVTAGHCFRQSTGGDLGGVWRFGSDGNRYKIGTIWTTSVTTTGNVSGRSADLAFYRLDPVASSPYSPTSLGTNLVFVGRKHSGVDWRVGMGYSRW